MKESYQVKNKKHFKSFDVDYDTTLQAMVLIILDTKGMYPCYLRDPEAGTYKITKTENGKLLMNK
jgi:hypothetical protein